MRLKEALKGKYTSLLGMLFFVVVFYSLLFFSGRLTAEDPSLKAVLKKTSVANEKLTPEKMAQKEARFKANLLARPRLMRNLNLLSFFTLLSGLAVNIYWFKRFLLEKPLLEAKINFPEAGWGMFEVSQVFVGLFFVEACFLLVELAASPWVRRSVSSKDFLVILSGFGRDFIIALWVIHLVTSRFHEPLTSLGLTLKNLFKNIRVGLVAYLGILPLLAFLLALTAVLAQVFSYDPPAQAVVEIYFKKSTEKFIIFLTFFVTVAGPVVEEIFFRGFAYGAARKRYGPVVAMLLTSFIFSVMHLSWLAFLPIFFLGIFLAYLYEKTGSLVPSMSAHILHNVIMVCLTLGFKKLSA